MCVCVQLRPNQDGCIEGVVESQLVLSTTQGLYSSKENGFFLFTRSSPFLHFPLSLSTTQPSLYRLPGIPSKYLPFPPTNLTPSVSLCYTLSHCFHSSLLPVHISLSQHLVSQTMLFSSYCLQREDVSPPLKLVHPPPF